MNIIPALTPHPRRRSLALAAAVFALTGLLGPAQAQTVWNPTTEFSAVNNPNGVWTYGGMDVGFTTFTPFTVESVDAWGFQVWWFSAGQNPDVAYNPTGTASFNVPPGHLTLHPGPGTEPAVLRWTAPVGFSGSVDIVGQFLTGDSGNMQLAVRRGATALWTGTDSGAFNLPGLSVSAGDTFDFAVFGGWIAGNTPLELSITGTSAIPEPSTWSVLLGVGVLAGAIWSRRQRTRVSHVPV